MRSAWRYDIQIMARAILSRGPIGALTDAPACFIYRRMTST